MPSPKPKKLWETSRKLRVIKRSKYEFNVSSRNYWHEIVGRIEEEIQSDKLTDTNIRKFKEILPTSTFRQIQKVLKFKVPAKEEVDSVFSEESGSVLPSEEFYILAADLPPSKPELVHIHTNDILSESPSLTPSVKTAMSIAGSEEEESVEDESVHIAALSPRGVATTPGRAVSSGSPCHTDESLDDKFVHVGRNSYDANNPHHELLHTNKSESDMISWDSKYKPKKMFVSASDAFSRRAELVTKQIAIGFINYFNSLGSEECTSQITKPEDIEILFQVWFDELVSRGLTIDPKILPCVLQQVADASGDPDASCSNMTRRQVNLDIKAEMTPKNLVAFNTALPQKMKHVPPDNNTKALWDNLVIPKDLETMSYIWEDIQHLSTTKSFYHWLLRHPTKPIPACMDKYFTAKTKKSTFVVPSDLIIRETSEELEDDLRLPISAVNIKMKEVLNSMTM